MLETMEDADGAGLAAPQVHVPLRVVIFHVPAGRDEENPATGTPQRTDQSGCRAVEGRGRDRLGRMSLGSRHDGRRAALYQGAVSGCLIGGRAYRPCGGGIPRAGRAARMRSSGWHSLSAANERSIALDVQRSTPISRRRRPGRRGDGGVNGEDQRRALMRASVRHVPFDGWSECALRAGAKDIDIPVGIAAALFPGRQRPGGAALPYGRRGGVRRPCNTIWCQCACGNAWRQPSGRGLKSAPRTEKPFDGPCRCLRCPETPPSAPGCYTVR